MGILVGVRLLELYSLNTIQSSDAVSTRRHEVFLFLISKTFAQKFSS